MQFSWGSAVLVGGLSTALSCLTLGPLPAQVPAAGGASAPSADLERRIAALEQQLADALRRIAVLEETIAEAKKRPSPPKAPRDKESTSTRRPLLPLGSRLAGDLVTQGKGSGREKVDAEVTRQDGREFTLRTRTENNAIWVWECVLNGNRFEVRDYRRDRASDGVTRPAGTAGIQARGTYDPTPGLLVLTYEWDRGRGHGGMLTGTYTLRLRTDPAQ